jgi:NADP-dependent 3-hydroxy acid dehydrogenase YdfG
VLPEVRKGRAVLVGACRTDRLTAPAERIHTSGGRVEAVPTDVTRRADLERLVATAVERFGRPSTLSA